jgi:hypothetical protein
MAHASSSERAKKAMFMNAQSIRLDQLFVGFIPLKSKESTPTLFYSKSFHAAMA